MELIHYTIDCYGCDSNLLDNEHHLVSGLKSISEKFGFNILSFSSAKFKPVGVTAYLVLSESHMSIHTWPELEFAAVDFFSCRSPDIDDLKQAIQNLIDAAHIKEKRVYRGEGLPEHSHPNPRLTVVS